VISTDAHESIVGRKVVDAVRDRLADGIAGKVMHVDPLGLTFRLPFAAAVLEVADEFFLLGIDGNDRDATLDTVSRFLVDMLELCVALRVLSPFD
jgi:hypothetical protein